MLTFLSIIQFVLVLAIVAYLGFNVLFLKRVEPITGSLPVHPFVSICVPARNEQRDIEACLTSLLEQEYPNFEVIVVDDHSTDNTPNIIQSLQERFDSLVAIQGAELPCDWYGKPFALHQAGKKARGELLLFTDADPVFQPNALKTAVGLMQSHQLDMLSLLPRAEFGSFWERTIQPVIFAFITALTRFKQVNDQKSKSAMGVGAFIMLRGEAYNRVGGHEPLKQAILEDIGMARLMKRSGAKIMLADGRELYSIRMYHSLKEIWVGWRKNIFLAMKKSIFKTFYTIFGLLGFVVTPWLLAGVYMMLESGLMEQVLAWSGLGLVVVTKYVLCHELNLEKRYLLLFPLGAVMTTLIMINSMIHVLFRGQSEWRGRTYLQPER